MAKANDMDYIEAVNDFRARKDEEFGSSPDSPIGREERQAGFAGLSYYPPNPAYRVVASVTPFEQQDIVQLGSTKGDIRRQVRYAELRFSLSGQTLRLTGYQAPEEMTGDELFVPFRDTTSGHETYGAGRYLEVQIEEGPDGAHFALLDFNLAYNPWCAYSPAYSCTLPPMENTMPIAIPAGERVYSAHA